MAQLTIILWYAYTDRKRKWDDGDDDSVEEDVLLCIRACLTCTFKKLEIHTVNTANVTVVTIRPEEDRSDRNAGSLLLAIWTGEPAIWFL